MHAVCMRAFGYMCVCSCVFLCMRECSPHLHKAYLLTASKCMHVLLYVRMFMHVLMSACIFMRVDACACVMMLARARFHACVCVCHPGVKIYFRPIHAHTCAPARLNTCVCVSMFACLSHSRISVHRGRIQVHAHGHVCMYVAPRFGGTLRPQTCECACVCVRART